MRRSELSWGDLRLEVGSFSPGLGERGAVPLRLLCWLRLRPAAAALPVEEFEGFLDELCVVLEDAAVAGVGVDHQLAVGQAAGQVG